MKFLHIGRSISSQSLWHHYTSIWHACLKVRVQRPSRRRLDWQKRVHRLEGTVLRAFHAELQSFSTQIGTKSAQNRKVAIHETPRAPRMSEFIYCRTTWWHMRSYEKQSTSYGTRNPPVQAVRALHECAVLCLEHTYLSNSSSFTLETTSGKEIRSRTGWHKIL